MPLIAKFEGVTIKMYLRKSEHNPPHVHAIYGDCVGMFSLEKGEMLEGDIPMKQQRMIKDFIIYYQEQLYEMWSTQKFERLSPIV